MLQKLEAACLEHGADLAVSPAYGLSASISKTVSRMGEIAPVLRAVRKAGFPKFAVKDQPEYSYREWSTGTEKCRLTVSAHVNAASRCRFVQVGETETVIPATEARTVRTPILKLMCE